ncbi:MAG: hypothetical protein H6672_00065, partial [Anaerolineaceae bacterium]|nr:hypothetical protein [Anaerolineaceae bacterium]
MSEQHHGKTPKPLNANLVALLLVAIFVLVSGVIFIRPSDVESAPENGAE